jgi:hypothetical protein
MALAAWFNTPDSAGVQVRGNPTAEPTTGQIQRMVVTRSLTSDG